MTLLKKTHRHDVHQGICDEYFIRTQKFFQTVRSFLERKSVMQRIS